MYRYRNVQCEYCNHMFNWIIDGNVYLVKNKNALIAKCPNCGEKLFVFDKELTGRCCDLFDDKDIKLMKIKLT